MRRTDIDFLAGYIIIIGFIILLCSFIAGCDSTWAIAGWEIK